MQRDLQVVKSNHLITAAYRLTLSEQRLILACIAKVQRNGPVSDDQLYRVSASELGEIFDTDAKSTYRDLADAAARLFERRVTILLEPDGTGRHARKRHTRWVQTVDYLQGAGCVELRFSRDILPYLTGLSEQFTRYNLSAVSRITSSHGIRLFELLCQYVKLGRREVSIEDLRTWLDLRDSYPAIKDLKLRVITPAVEQINLNSPLQVSWEQRKTGRAVTHLVFIVSRKPAERRSAKRVLSDAEVARMARPGESWAQARARLGARQ